MGNMTEFNRPDGGQTNGYLSTSTGNKGGVVIIQEWWGLNDQICGVADRFARAGYNALAPDLYKGRVTQDPDEAGHMMNGLDFPGATHQDIRGAARHLLDTSSKVAVMGFCMGGALTLASAVHVPECSAGICFYGIPPDEFASPKDIRVPFQGHFANQDDWCTPAAVDELENTLQQAKVGHSIFRYDAAHAFFNEQSDAYNVAAQRDSWIRATNFLEETL